MTELVMYCDTQFFYLANSDVPDSYSDGGSVNVINYASPSAYSNAI